LATAVAGAVAAATANATAGAATGATATAATGATATATAGAATGTTAGAATGTTSGAAAAATATATAGAATGTTACAAAPGALSVEAGLRCVTCNYLRKRKEIFRDFSLDIEVFSDELTTSTQTGSDDEREAISTSVTHLFENGRQAPLTLRLKKIAAYPSQLCWRSNRMLTNSFKNLRIN